MLLRLIFRLMPVVMFLMIAGCGSDEPIRIGYSGPLTGRYSDLGVNGRNGTEMAVREFNDKGGVNGRMVELIIKDDFGTTDGAVKAVKELMTEQVLGIVGPLTSTQGMALQDYIMKWKGALVSPTISTPALDGRVDNFYRVMPTNNDRASALADYCYDIMKIQSIMAIGDQDNASYVNSFIDAFIKRFKKKSGKELAKYNFKSTLRKNWDEVLTIVREKKPGALLVVASPRDTASLAQTLMSKGMRKPILGSTWASSRELLMAGGRAVEGFVFASVFNEHINYPPYWEFKKRYTDRYGYKPNYSAAYSYEATSVLLSALLKCNGELEELHVSLRSLPEFSGILNPFTLTDSGDVKREAFILEVNDGKFVEVTAIK